MKMKQLLAALLISGTSLAVSVAWAAPAGQITHLSGILSAKKPDGSSRILSVKSEVMEGDLLSTEDNAYARVKFIDGGEVVLRPNSQLKVDQYSYDEAKPQSDNVFMSMLKGGLRAVTGAIGKRNQSKISYQTPTATIGIRGTHWGMLFCPPGGCAGFPTPTGQPPGPGLHLDVQTGAISVTNGAGTFTFDAGKFAYVPGPNLPPIPVPPEQGFRVTAPGGIMTNRGTGGGIGGSGAADCGAE